MPVTHGVGEACGRIHPTGAVGARHAPTSAASWGQSLPRGWVWHVSHAQAAPSDQAANARGTCASARDTWCDAHAQETGSSAPSTRITEATTSTRARARERTELSRSRLRRLEVIWSNLASPPRPRRPAATSALAGRPAAAAARSGAAPPMADWVRRLAREYRRYWQQSERPGAYCMLVDLT